MKKKTVKRITKTLDTLIHTNAVDQDVMLGAVSDKDLLRLLQVTTINYTFDLDKRYKRLAKLIMYNILDRMKA